MAEEIEKDKPTLIQDEPAPEVAPAAPAPRVEQYVRVLPGETIQSFAERHGTTVEAIVERNKVNPDYVFANHWLWV